MTKKYLIILLLLVSPMSALSAPSITGVSGTVTDGETITISGSTFGSGPDVVVFDDFESGTLGANIATGVGSAKYGQWDARAGSSYYGSEHNSGSKSFMSNYGVGTYTNYLKLANLNTTEVFVSWHYKVIGGFPGYTDVINFKPFWLYDSGIADADRYFPGLSASSWIIGGNDNEVAVYYSYIDYSMTVGQWKHSWIRMKGSTSSTSADGVVKLESTSAGGIIVGEDTTTANTLRTGNVWNNLDVNAFGNESSGTYTAYDDVYVAKGANAQARIEIGDAATYADCTKLTILTPTSWSSSSISAVVNSGAFSTEESAYLFVIDSSGGISAGSSVTIGDSPPSLSSTTINGGQCFGCIVR